MNKMVKKIFYIIAAALFLALIKASGIIDFLFPEIF